MWLADLFVKIAPPEKYRLANFILKEIFLFRGSSGNDHCQALDSEQVHARCEPEVVLFPESLLAWEPVLLRKL
jgi:hypothetical protein